LGRVANAREAPAALHHRNLIERLDMTRSVSDHSITNRAIDHATSVRSLRGKNLKKQNEPETGSVGTIARQGGYSDGRGKRNR
jgi:hypothetical protein